MILRNVGKFLSHFKMLLSVVAPRERLLSQLSMRRRPFAVVPSLQHVLTLCNIFRIHDVSKAKSSFITSSNAELSPLYGAGVDQWTPRPGPFNGPKRI
jgi:hypothetical protein